MTAAAPEPVQEIAWFRRCPTGGTTHLRPSTEDTLTDVITPEFRVELLRLINEHRDDAEELAHELIQLFRPDGPGCWAEDERGGDYRGPEYRDRNGHGWRPLSDEPRLWWAPQYPIPLTFDELREQHGPLSEVARA